MNKLVINARTGKSTIVPMSDGEIVIRQNDETRHQSKSDARVIERQQRKGRKINILQKFATAGFTRNDMNSLKEFIDDGNDN